ncbi:hypothetical protein PoB_001011700 [Plakobranchus ocellatus]|uniref:Uncharacterized protein n=1 Tax=Plakobranchus ocellatus TaxID=259542 RepID=A0AAV3YL17_9GAST|nr:hypothetical protein PoB_001011700 [Plakobranchus ocellatus]
MTVLRFLGLLQTRAPMVELELGTEGSLQIPGQSFESSHILQKLPPNLLWFSAMARTRGQGRATSDFVTYSSETDQKPITSRYRYIDSDSCFMYSQPKTALAVSQVRLILSQKHQEVSCHTENDHICKNSYHTLA